MDKAVVEPDVAIIGGGIAGLWLTNRLRNLGYSALLFEHRALGSDQTVASQGMIHGGIKYALGGSLSGGSEAIAEMPDRWRECLRGDGDVDLTHCKVLSEEFYLWSDAKLLSRMTSFFASKSLRGRVDKINSREGPEVFRDPAFRGQLYRLVDLVLDAPSLVRTLADNHADAVFALNWSHSELRNENGLAVLDLPGVILKPKKLVLSAGAGNEGLLQALGEKAPKMQRRPLQQVLVKHEYPHPLYAHCTGTNPSPRLTVSSHHCSDGSPVWYLGGDLATEGTDDAPDVLIEKARAELKALFHWVDFGQMEWTTIKLDRAEPRQSNLLKPDQAFTATGDTVRNLITAWPTKLTLSPDLGDRVVSDLGDLQPGPAPDLTPLATLGRPPVAPTPWDEAFL